MDNDRINRLGFFSTTLLNDIKTDLHKLIDNKRFAHSVRVAILSEEIAAVYGVCTEKAKLAALLHDFSRYMSNQELLVSSVRYGYLPDDIEKQFPILLHAFVSAAIAKETYGIRDEEILSAIRNHTTGQPNMSVLDKIVYIADYIEPHRKLDPMVISDIKDELFKYKNINKAVMLVLDHVLMHLSETGKVIHPRTMMLKTSMAVVLN